MDTNDGGKTWLVGSHGRHNGKHTHEPPAPSKLKSRAVRLEPDVEKQGTDIASGGTCNIFFLFFICFSGTSF